MYDMVVHRRRRIITFAEPLFSTAAVSSSPYIGPGDIVSGASAWWGLRAYSAAVAGMAAIRLRRDSDNAEQDINTRTTGDLDKAAIASFQGAANIFVVTIYDQTGNGNHLTQATTTKQPALTANVVGLFYGMTFTAASVTELALAGTLATPPNQPFTTVIAAKRNPRVSSFDYFFGCVNNGAMWGGTADHVFLSSAAASAEVSATDGSFHSFQNIFNGASSTITVDGVTSGSLNPSTNSFASSSVRIAGDGAGDNMSGNGLEYGVWAGAFDAGQLSNMNNNQHNYWGF